MSKNLVVLFINPFFLNLEHTRKLYNFISFSDLSWVTVRAITF